MQSNRESARRSRQRKQLHLDELTSLSGHLRKENSEIVNAISVTSRQYLSVEAENSVLRAQMVELSSRLQSLNEILSCINCESFDDGGRMMMMMMDRPWGMMMNDSVDMYQYC